MTGSPQPPRTIYYLSSEGDDHNLWRVAADGSAREQLTVGRGFYLDVTVGPDGSLAYSNNVTDDYELWVEPRGGEPRQLTNSPGLDGGPTFSPDGQTLLFEWGRTGQLEIWRVPVQGWTRDPCDARRRRTAAAGSGTAIGIGSMAEARPHKLRLGRISVGPHAQRPGTADALTPNVIVGHLSRMNSGPLVRPALLLLVLLVLPARAPGFALFPDPGPGTPAEVLENAARWSSATGLSDGLQVGIGPGVAAALQVPGDALADVEQAIVDGILAWESPALAFDITLDAPGTVLGANAGFEIDVFAVDSLHPVFLTQPQLFGLAVPSVSFLADRPLTNGQASSGLAIHGADIFFNTDMFAFLGPLGSARLDVLTRVTIHELGHALGLGHPNESTNYDTNTDPFDAMPIDPADPFSGLIVSPNVDETTIMSNAPCGPNPSQACPAVFFTSLGPDEIGGRDVLYPVPEPGLGALLALALLRRATRPRGRRPA